jgi:hypothetical protein
MRPPASRWRNAPACFTLAQCARLQAAFSIKVTAFRLPGAREQHRSFSMSGKLKTALFGGMSLAVGCFALAAVQAARAETLGPVISSAPAKILGEVNFSAAAASRSNEDAVAALAHGRQIAPRPRLLPDGREARGIMPRLSTLAILRPTFQCRAAVD